MAKEEGIAHYSWLKKYRDFGEAGLINKRKPRNPFAALNSMLENKKKAIQSWRLFSTPTKVLYMPQETSKKLIKIIT